MYLKYERAALEAAAFDLQQGEIQSCLDACSRLLEIEPGQERAWRLSMRAYAELGDRGSIVKVYRQCRRNLSSHLGINPSKETEILYQNLLK
ncbi:MAG: bacterial transcriptional activator domain-containing protein [Anaerolineales bacterium]